jgi:hypothetical protein
VDIWNEGLESAAMPLRHQIFVIARVGEHHRCLAVVHHQRLYDIFVLKACLRLVDIFSAKSTRRALESELRLAAEFYKGQPAPTKPESQPDYEAHRSSPVRFPFIATCLILGSSLDLWEDPRRHGGRPASLGDEDVGFDQSQNDTGITVLDITDLCNVRYCFTALQHFNKLLSASEYIQHSRAVPIWSVDDSENSELDVKLGRVPLIPGSTLAGEFLVFGIAVLHAWSVELIHPFCRRLAVGPLGHRPA